MFLSPKPPQTKMQHQTHNFKRLLSPPSVYPPACLSWLCGEAQSEYYFVQLGNRIPVSLLTNPTHHLVLSCGSVLHSLAHPSESDG